MSTELVLYTLSVVFIFRILLYSLGEPHLETPNQYSILFFYSYFLAKRKLKIQNLMTTFNDYINNPNLTIEQKKDLHLMIFQKGKKHFTWELAFGMCGVCTFWWLSFFIILLPNLNIYGLFMFAFSNILNKIVIKWI